MMLADDQRRQIGRIQDKMGWEGKGRESGFACMKVTIICEPACRCKHVPGHDMDCISLSYSKDCGQTFESSTLFFPMVVTQP